VSSIKTLIIKYISEILLLVLLVIFYLHTQETRELLYVLHDTIELMDSSVTQKGDLDWRSQLNSIDKNLTQISIFLIFFVGIFKLSKHNKPFKQDK
jgi:hypothetical protein